MICCNSTSVTHHCQDHLECGAGSGGPTLTISCSGWRVTREDSTLSSGPGDMWGPPSVESRLRYVCW